MLMFLYKIISYFEPKLLMTWLFQYSSFIFMWINIHESNFVFIHFRKYHFKVLIILIILNLDFSSPIHFFLTWNLKKFSLSFKYIRKKCDDNSWLNYFWSTLSIHWKEIESPELTLNYFERIMSLFLMTMALEGKENRLAEAFLAYRRSYVNVW